MVLIGIAVQTEVDLLLRSSCIFWMMVGLMPIGWPGMLTAYCLSLIMGNRNRWRSINRKSVSEIVCVHFGLRRTQ